MRRLVRFVAVVTALALVPAGAAAQPDLRHELEETRDEREQVQEELAEVEREEGDARARLASIEQELADAESGLEQLAGELAAAEAAHETAERRSRQARIAAHAIEEELAAAEAELAAKRERFDGRVRAAFKYGGVSFAESLAVLASSQDVNELLNTSTYLTHVMEGDRALVHDVHALLDAIDRQRAEADVLRRDAEREAAAAARATAEVERAAEEQQRLTELVRDQRAAREAALEALREDRAAIEGHLAGLDAESQRIQDQLAAIARQQAEEARRAEEAARRAEEEARRAAEEAAAGEDVCDQAGEDGDGSAELEGEGGDGAQSDDAACDEQGPPPSSTPPSTGTSGGDDSWIRPVGGAVTSPFGPRWGRNHNGVDLGGSVGTGVVASQAGLVVSVTSGCHARSSWGCGGGFGNYVMVSHDGGMATIYAHLSSVEVGSGQQLAAGQSLGAVGNSGNSYGPHLHFEVREAGAARNPCNYIRC